MRRARRQLPPRHVPLLGLAAAFVFASQMLNFPVAGGTSGHLIGATLTAALLGPSAAVIVISAVLIVQCFLFADGGITSLGANIFNMALIGGVGGWVIYYTVSQIVPGIFGRIFAATFAAWCATVAASIACAGELAASGMVKWNVALPAMAGVHMLIGIGEAIVTALVLSAVCANRPNLILTPNPQPGKSYGMIALYGSLIAIGLALFFPPIASKLPDGLDYVAKSLGFEGRSTTIVNAAMPEYRAESFGSGNLATSIAALIGTVVALGLGWGLARVLVRKNVAPTCDPPP
jgi:cobalt/nickel transport system permease protein